jgi:hypothetical protein
MIEGNCRIIDAGLQARINYIVPEITFRSLFYNANPT